MANNSSSPEGYPIPPNIPTEPQNFFVLQPEAAAEMERRLANAAANAETLQMDGAVNTNTVEETSTEGRVLRSAGKVMQWNPNMDSQNVILEQGTS